MGADPAQGRGARRLLGRVHPRPRLAFGLALPTAAESLAEYLDVELVGEQDVAELTGRIADTLPPGFTLQALSVIDRGDPSLQQDVIACSWELTLPELTIAAAEAATAGALAAEELLLERERKGERRVDDLRPAIESLSVRAGDGPTVLARLATQPRGMRPSELLAVVFPELRGPEAPDARILRTTQWIERDGARRDLLPLDAAVAARPDLVRA